MLLLEVHARMKAANNSEMSKSAVIIGSQDTHKRRYYPGYQVMVRRLCIYFFSVPSQQPKEAFTETMHGSRGPLPQVEIYSNLKHIYSKTTQNTKALDPPPQKSDYIYINISLKGPIGLLGFCLYKKHRILSISFLLFDFRPYTVLIIFSD